MLFLQQKKSHCGDKTILQLSCIQSGNAHASNMAFTAMELTFSGLISNYMSNKVWDEITCAFQNFNGCTIEVWWIGIFIPYFIMYIIIYPFKVN